MMIPLIKKVSYETISNMSVEEVNILKSTCKILHITKFKKHTLDFLNFAKKFGEVEISQPPEYRTQSSSFIGIISNKSEYGFSKAGSYWHSDSTFLTKPPKFTALRCINMPTSGGETMFVDMQSAYESLPLDTQNLINDLIGIHSFQKIYKETYKKRGLSELDDSKLNLYPDQGHPLVFNNETKEIKALYLNEMYLTGIKDMDDNKAKELIASILDHTCIKSNIYYHQWDYDDVLLWDNKLVMHKANKVECGVKICERAVILK